MNNRAIKYAETCRSCGYCKVSCKHGERERLWCLPVIGWVGIDEYEDQRKEVPEGKVCGCFVWRKFKERECE